MCKQRLWRYSAYLDSKRRKYTRSNQITHPPSPFSFLPPWENQILRVLCRSNATGFFFLVSYTGERGGFLVNLFKEFRKREEGVGVWGSSSYIIFFF